jgi:hypothetical protein
MAPDARALALRRLQTGSTRLALGSVACALADMAELIQICFALALVALWLGLPIAAVLVLFAPDLRPVGAILRRAVSVVVTSWLVSLLMGLLTACLAAAASTGSATAALALAVGGVLLAGRLLLVAASTLTESLTGLGGILGAAAGGAALSVGAGVGSLAARAVSTGGSLAGGAADAAGSLAGGAAATIATATIAAGRSGDWRSGAAVAIGRIRPVAQVGAVAAAMGAAPPALADALEEGQRVARAGVVAYAREARAARASAGTGVDAAHGRAEGQVRAGVQRARAAAARGDAEQPAEVVGEPKVVTI